MTGDEPRTPGDGLEIDTVGSTESRIRVCDWAAELPAASTAPRSKTLAPSVSGNGPAVKAWPLSAAGAPLTVTCTASSTVPVIVTSTAPVRLPLSGSTVRNTGGVRSMVKLTVLVALLPAASVASTTSWWLPSVVTGVPET